VGDNQPLHRDLKRVCGAIRFHGVPAQLIGWCGHQPGRRSCRRHSSEGAIFFCGHSCPRRLLGAMLRALCSIFSESVSSLTARGGSAHQNVRSHQTGFRDLGPTSWQAASNQLRETSTWGGPHNALQYLIVKLEISGITLDWHVQTHVGSAAIRQY
jgi:hypothetical protein